MLTLKPCPFCGSTASHSQFTGNGFTLPRVKYTEVRCDKCHITTEPQQLLFPDKDKALAAWNTRPAAPVEGLEVVAYRYRHVDYVNWTYSESKHPRPDIHNEELVTRPQAGAIIAELQAKAKDYREHSERLEKRLEREEVTRSRAVELLAAKDAEWQVAANLGSEVNRNLASRVNALEADNAALTARVKRLDTPYNPMAEALATDKVKTLEAQLAAAEKALEPFSKYAAMLFERNYNDTDIINVFGEHRLTARDFFDARVASETGR
ncbi:restriction alleviation, Lar family protein [Ochrobactrum quorumnocens]|uniref:Restriction alleviation, Lar family protein n=1 Tax=Ochrobactrum quorumnocens TaxID=271865 RepID=A0A248UHG9_9HYPH|nr:Lar family restriction alleviation protein [[Ochrobactrum] quorumnocens]ASV86114.1 restriction alleviation, Lar family protein [[Ochrobactrum] quorumnocens]